MSEPIADAGAPERPPSLVTHIAVTMVILAGGAAVLGLTGLGLLVGLIAAWVAIPYTAVAIVGREITARWGRVQSGPQSSGRALAATGFALYSQRASLVTAVVMLAVLVAILVPGGPLDQPGDVLSIPAFLLLGTAAAAGVFAIAVNAASIYRAAVVRAERRAIQDRVGAWGLILATTILTTASWIGYCGLAVRYLVGAW